MIRCGLAMNLNGRWEVQELFPHLREIVQKYKENVDGKPVADSVDLDQGVTEYDFQKKVINLAS